VTLLLKFATKFGSMQPIIAGKTIRKRWILTDWVFATCTSVATWKILALAETMCHHLNLLHANLTKANQPYIFNLNEGSSYLVKLEIQKGS